MQYVVIVRTCRTRDDKRGYIQYLNVRNEREATRVADALSNTMNDTSATIGIRFWKVEGGSVILDNWQVQQIADFATSGEDSTGKPSFDREAVAAE